MDTVGRCARCGRQGPEDPAEGLRPAPDSPRPPDRAPAWASIGGADVCPDCQTAQERLEVSRRIVRLIEREGERRQREGSDTDPYEAALTSYAMGLREHADTVGEQLATPPRPEPDADALRLHVAFTGAFLTGNPLSLAFEDYEHVQGRLRDQLPAGWRVDGLRDPGGTYASGGGFSEAVPLVIARREGGNALLDELSGVLDQQGAAGATPGPYAPLVSLTPKSLAVDVYDLGVAVLTAEFDVTAANGQLKATARALKQLVWLRNGSKPVSRLAVRLQEVATSTTQEYADAISTAAPTTRHPSWLAHGGSGWSTVQREAGRLLWLHPVHVLHTGDAPELAARELAPAFSKSIDLDGGVFAAGIGSSAAVLTTGSSETPVRLTSLHWAYYALYMEIDRGLLGVLREDRWGSTGGIEQLEADVDDVFSKYMWVEDARARLDSALCSLGGDELAIWDTIARVQRFDAVVEAVERKLEVLEKVAQRRLAQATTYRARRIADVLGYLSALTLLTVVGGTISVVLGSRSNAVDALWLRIVLLAVAALIGFSGYWLTFVRSKRLPIPRTRSRRRASSATGDARGTSEEPRARQPSVR